MDKKLLDQTFELMKKHLRYSDEEFALYKANPKNTKVLARALEMRQKTIVFEVIESSGCNSGHDAGTRFFFSGDGNLLTKWCPNKICAFALPIMSQAIFGLQELWYAGVDPNEMCFRRAGCFDVGVACGGWGRIILEAKVVDKEEAAKLVNP